MSEKDLTGQIRFSYGISLLRAVLRSLGVILVIGLLVILGDLLPLAGSSVPLISLILLVFVCLNMLGYIELSASSPRKGGAYRMVQACEEGNWLSFLTGWSLILAGISAAGTLVLAFAQQGASLVRSLFDFSLPKFALAATLLILVFIYRLFPVKKNRRYYLLIIFLCEKITE